jgi:hypothetical protein
MLCPTCSWASMEVQDECLLCPSCGTKVLNVWINSKPIDLERANQLDGLQFVSQPEGIRNGLDLRF